MRRPLLRALLASALAGLVASATPAGAQYLFWVDAYHPSPALRRSDLAGGNLATLAMNPGRLPEGLAYDALNNALYWTEAARGNARIMRGGPGLAPGDEVYGGQSALRGIAVHAAAGHLYWTTSDQVAGAKVMRSGLFGQNPVTLVDLAGYNPRGIAVDRTRGKLYWAEFESDAIFRSNTDGTNWAVFVSLPAGARPYGVAVDEAANQVYWAEYGSGNIQRTVGGGPVPAAGPAPARDPDGRPAVARLAAGPAPETHALVRSGLARPTYLAIDAAGGRIYVVEAGTSPPRIARLNLDGTGLTTIAGATIAAYGGITLHGGSLVDAAPPADDRPRELSFALASGNPARGRAAFGVALPAAADVRVEIADVMGRRVATLASGPLEAGEHRLEWTGRGAGGAAPPGVYLARLVADGRVLVRRFVFLR